jgi:hypothetical protein
MRHMTAVLHESEELRWMDPIARDVISASYAPIKGDPATIAGIARCHVLIWRASLAGRDDLGLFKRELFRLAAQAGVSEDALDQVDRQVLAELLDTVASRYSRSPREASRLSYDIATAACRMAQVRTSLPGHDLALAKRSA